MSKLLIEHYNSDNLCLVKDLDLDKILLEVNSSKSECFMLASNIISGNFGQSCSIEETNKIIAPTKQLINAFLLTELTIVIVIFTIRVMKQLRPI